MLCDDPEGWGGGGEGGEEGRGHMYNYGRLALLYGRNPHNVVKLFL